MFQINQIINLRAENRAKIYEQALVAGDKRAHTWRVTVLEGTRQVPLDGMTAEMFVTRADGRTVESQERITIDGHAVSAELPGEVYGVEGPVVLEMVLRRGEETVTCAQLGAFVKRTRTDDVIVPGTGELYDVYELLRQIDAMKEATSSANAAAASANAWANATATATGLAAGSAPTVSVGTENGKKVLQFGIPKGDRGEKGETGGKGDKGDKGDTGATGKSGVAVSETEPTDPEITVWIRPDGSEDGEAGGDAGDAGAYASAEEVNQLRDEINALHPLAIDRFTVSPAMAEKGSTVTAQSFAYAVNRPSAQVTIEGEAVSGGSAARADVLTADRTYTLTAVLGGAQKTATAKVAFVAPVYYGVSASAAPEDGTVLALTRVLTASRARTITVNAGEGEYILYALPEALGVPVFKVGGFEGGFALAGVFDLTNASGHTESYRLYRSVNAGLGATTVTVS